MNELRRMTFLWNQTEHPERRGRGGIARRFSGHLFGVAPLVFCAFLIWPFGGSGKKYQMMAGQEVPGARGVVSVNQGGNGNKLVDVKVHALAPPSSLQPPANFYLVWIQEPGHSPQNMGQIQVNQHEEGELDTKTPYPSFKVFVTAEPNVQEHEPQGATVLSVDVPAS